MTFRMMPRQVNTRPDEAHTRFGFAMHGHPLGDPGHNGLYIASWDDWDTAFAAAYCLGVNPFEVVAIGFLPYIEPVEEDWRDIDTDPPKAQDMGKIVELQANGDALTRFRGRLEADAWLVTYGDERTPISKVGDRSIYDFTHWRVLHNDPKLEERQ